MMPCYKIITSSKPSNHILEVDEITRENKTCVEIPTAKCIPPIPVDIAK